MSHKSTLSTIAACLQRDAELLASRYSDPLNLDELLQDLGLELRFEDRSSACGYAGCDGALVRERRGKWVVIVSGSETEPSPHRRARQKFTIAHEIGHYIIEGRFRYRPGGLEEHRRVEDICNAFAPKLLRPDWIVLQAIAGAVDAPAWRDALQVMEEGGLSLRAGVRRLLEMANFPVAFVLLQQGGGGSVRWVERSRDWPGGRGGGGSANALFRNGLPFSSLKKNERKVVSVRGCDSACLERLSGDRFIVTAVARGGKREGYVEENESKLAAGEDVDVKGHSQTNLGGGTGGMSTHLKLFE